jgi:hypothetical protein
LPDQKSSKEHGIDEGELALKPMLSKIAEQWPSRTPLDENLG